MWVIKVEKPHETTKNSIITIFNVAITCRLGATWWWRDWRLENVRRNIAYANALPIIIIIILFQCLNSSRYYPMSLQSSLNPVAFVRFFGRQNIVTSWWTKPEKRKSEKNPQTFTCLYIYIITQRLQLPTDKHNIDYYIETIIHMFTEY